jgi:mannosyl-oligosaccharide alpha-1,2-mannosidase
MQLPKWRVIRPHKRRYFRALAAFVIIIVYMFSANFHALPFGLFSSGTSAGGRGLDIRKVPYVQHEFDAEKPDFAAVRLKRQAAVKSAFVHAWEGYKGHAWLKDELMPISGGYIDTFNGWAATMVDGLDTLWIMDLKEDFEKTVEAIATINFQEPHQDRIEIFENTIRYLGGLLGAYDVSEGKYSVLLDKAKELAELLFRAFQTENGLPVPYYWWKKDEPLLGETAVLVAQMGSLSLEFTRLAQLTGDRKYYDAISRITDIFDGGQANTSIPGLWPSQMDTTTASFSYNSYTFGAFADSLYEYLIKVWLIRVYQFNANMNKEHILLNGNSDQYLRMYNWTYMTAKERLFFRPKIPGRWDILFPGSATANHDGSSSINPEVQHLGCFTGGMVGLGSKINGSPEQLDTAAKLTDGCVWAYQNAATGIMPEIFHLDVCHSENNCTSDGDPSAGKNSGFSVDDGSYKLRPEAIESVFVMYRLTGDLKWQNKGWKMFQAIQKYTRTEIGNAAISDVTNTGTDKRDSMESFWLAETLKYFYLLFSEPSLISLDDFVL